MLAEMSDRRREYQAIYLSPHLDDVVFSCGGQIFMHTSAGEQVLVVTVTAADPPAVPPSEFAQLLHARWQLTDDAVAARRAEDQLACQILGADYLHWNFLDCIYRQHPQTGEALYATVESIFGDIHPSDELLDQLTQQMGILPPHDRLYLPLTAGHHVDHQLTRLAAERCFGSAAAVYYYEDYPYVRDEAALLATLEAGGPGNSWEPILIPLSEAALEAKVAAVLAYESQLSTFFNGVRDVEVQIKDHARRVAESPPFKVKPLTSNAEGVADGQIEQPDIPAPVGAERVWQRNS